MSSQLDAPAARHDSLSPRCLAGKTTCPASAAATHRSLTLHLPAAAIAAPTSTSLQEILASMNAVLSLLKRQRNRHRHATISQALYTDIAKTLDGLRDLHAMLPGRSEVDDVEFEKLYSEGLRVIMEMEPEIERKEWWAEMDVGIGIRQDEVTGEGKLMIRVARREGGA